MSVAVDCLYPVSRSSGMASPNGASFSDVETVVDAMGGFESLERTEMESPDIPEWW